MPRKAVNAATLSQEIHAFRRRTHVSLLDSVASAFDQGKESRLYRAARDLPATEYAKLDDEAKVWAMSTGLGRQP